MRVRGRLSGYVLPMEAPIGSGNEVLRYLAILKAGRDFGLSHDEVAAIAGSFDPRETRCDELADALADLILARTPV
jgi:hypothetical protein